jgi:hypothetical protein
MYIIIIILSYKFCVSIEFYSLDNTLNFFFGRFNIKLIGLQKPANEKVADIICNGQQIVKRKIKHKNIIKT